MHHIRKPSKLLSIAQRLLSITRTPTGKRPVQRHRTQMASKDALALREGGNTLYKEGNYLAATEFYVQAAEADPHDPAPFSNASIASFEAGMYEQCLAYIQQALDVAGPDDTTRRIKLRARAAKCLISLNRWDEAMGHRAVLTGAENSNLLHSLEGRPRRWRSWDTQCSRKAIINGLSPFKTTLQHVAEYYPVGHDRLRPCSTRN